MGRQIPCMWCMPRSRSLCKPEYDSIEVVQLGRDLPCCVAQAASMCGTANPRLYLGLLSFNIVKDLSRRVCAGKGIPARSVIAQSNLHWIEPLDFHCVATIPKKRGRLLLIRYDGLLQGQNPSCKERETLHLFQPPRADQMPDPCRGRCHYIRPDNL